MVISFISILLFSMLYFINTLYFTLSLILTVITISVYSVYLGSISSLFSIMLVIIYVGAIIIFIGYICAISPNILLSSSTPISLLTLSPFIPFLFITNTASFNSNFSPLSDFLYSSSGVYLFALIAVVLFLVLIIVSSQFFSPQGPFRSVV